MTSGASELTHEAIASIEKDSSCSSVSGPLDNVPVVAAVHQGPKQKAWTGKVVHFQPAMQEFGCEVVHSVLVNVLWWMSVCTIIVF